jgi:hypothetical protein
MLPAQQKVKSGSRQVGLLASSNRIQTTFKQTFGNLDANFAPFETFDDRSRSALRVVTNRPMQLLATLAVVLLTAVKADAAEFMASNWRSCSPNGIINVTEVAVYPSPIRAGARATILLNTTQTFPVPGGSLTASVKYLGFKVYSKVGDLCIAVQCPLLPGSKTLTLKTDPMPRVLPPGRMQLLLRAEGNKPQKEPLFCIEIDLRNSAASKATAVS